MTAGTGTSAPNVPQSSRSSPDAETCCAGAGLAVQKANHAPARGLSSSPSARSRDRAGAVMNCRHPYEVIGCFTPTHRLEATPRGPRLRRSSGQWLMRRSSHPRYGRGATPDGDGRRSHSATAAAQYLGACGRVSQSCKANGLYGRVRSVFLEWRQTLASVRIECCVATGRVLPRGRGSDAGSGGLRQISHRAIVQLCLPGRVTLGSGGRVSCIVAFERAPPPASVAHLTFGSRPPWVSQPNVRCKRYTKIMTLLVFLMVLTFAPHLAARASKCRNHKEH